MRLLSRVTLVAGVLAVLGAAAAPGQWWRWSLAALILVILAAIFSLIADGEL